MFCLGTVKKLDILITEAMFEVQRSSLAITFRRIPCQINVYALMIAYMYIQTQWVSHGILNSQGW